MNLVDYRTFVAENTNSLNVKQSLLQQIMLNVAESADEKDFVQILIESNFYFDLESLNEESLKDKMKRKYDEIVDIAKKKGKAALSDTQEKIMKLGGNIVNVVKMIAEKVSQFIKAAWDKARTIAATATSKTKEELIEKAKSIKDKHLLSNEVGHFKDMAKAGVTWIVNGFPKQLATAEMKAVNTDESFNTEELEIFLLESVLEISEKENLIELMESEGGIPFISAIAHKLHDFPPFSLLHKASSAAEKAGKNALNKASAFLSEVTGSISPLEFVVLPVFIGLAVESKVEHISVEGILHLIPGIGTLVHILSTIALGLSIIAMIESVIKMEKEYKHDHEKTAEA
jgi:hypothetical protein